MYNPYLVLKEHPEIMLAMEPLPDGLRGIYASTQGKSLIILSSLLTQTERRCTLTHELAHYFLGHHDDYFALTSYTDECTYRKKEHDAWSWAADRLIDTHDFLSFSDSDHQLTVEEVAERFWVTTDILFFKLQRLVTLGKLDVFYLP